MVQQFENVLRQHANPERADPMSAYMKNKFPFLGISALERRKLTQGLIKSAASDMKCGEVIRGLYELPEREFHYVALDLTQKAARARKPVFEMPLSLFGHLARCNQWWDTIDPLATKIIGDWMRKNFPTNHAEEMKAWADSDDMWLNRASIIYQLHYKENTNLDFLQYAVEKHAESNEFFIQKAIGWALRQLTKTNPEWVRQLLNEVALKPLSFREAKKYLNQSISLPVVNTEEPAGEEPEAAAVIQE